MSDTPQLEVASGSGLLARRHSATLFLPDPGPADTEGLVATFLDAEADDVLLALETWLSTHGVEGRCFALIDWNDTIEVMVLGDLALCTDLPTLPLLTGAGSSTWVEHRVRVRPDQLIVTVGSEPPMPGSQLDAGAVPAGGFRLALGAPTPAEQPPAAGLAGLRAAMDGAATRAEAPADTLPADTLPAVPSLLLDDDRKVLLTGTMVVGRQPDAAAAKLDGGAIEIQHGSASTSRTHVLVASNGSSTTVTDCGTDNGTAVVPYEGANPFRLQPWIPQELDPGAQVFLGGPTWFRLDSGEAVNGV